MSTVINPNQEDVHNLTPQEAKAYFEGIVREHLGVSAEKFLQNKEKFKNNPHFESIMFLLPLVDNGTDKR